MVRYIPCTGKQTAGCHDSCFTWELGQYLCMLRFTNALEVCIDFLTKAMNSLISVLVDHLTEQAGGKGGGSY